MHTSAGPTTQSAREDLARIGAGLVAKPYVRRGVSMSNETIRIILVDDHAMVREGLRLLLRGAPDMVVVGEAGDGVAAVALVERMGAGATARASRVAPCLAGTGAAAPTEDQLAEARLVLVGAVRRWYEAGNGALSAQSAGPFSQTIDTRQRTGYNLWPSEIEALQQVCSAGSVGREAFSVDTATTTSLAGHSPYCDLHFGGASCSCGFSLTGTAPIYEPYL